MSRRDPLQDGLPMYVEGADLIDPGAMGVLTVSTPDGPRTMRTEQGSIFDALDDAAARPPRVMAASDAPAIGRFKPDGPDGYRARTAPAAPLRDTRAEAIEDERAHLDAPENAHDDDCAKAAGWRECGAWCPANDPDGCTRCGTPTDPLERFPGGLCLTCYTPIGEAKARTMTADRLARMWGAR